MLLKFNEEWARSSVNGALAIRKDINRIVDEICAQGYRNICWLGIGGTWASGMQAAVHMKEQSEIETWAENASEYNTTGNKRVGEGTVVITSSVTGSTGSVKEFHGDEQEGVLEQEERELIESVIEFDDKNVRDIMVPKDQVVFLYDNATYEQMKQVLHDHKLSRLPVISYQTTEVVGILRVRDVLDALLEDKEIVISEMMQEPVFVTQRKKLPAVLEDIQKSREHMAIVEESLTSHVFVGIVTLEDVLEELVGEIYDEYDPLPNHVVEIGHHTFTIDGNVSLVDFFDTYVEDQDAPKTKARTFAAWIFELNNHRKVRKGREIEFENFEIKVLDTKDGMAARIEMQILSQMDDDLD